MNISNIYMGSAPLLQETGGSSGSSSSIPVNYEIDYYDIITGKSYLETLTPNVAVEKYPLNGNKVLRIHFMSQYAESGISGNIPQIPVWLDLQFYNLQPDGSRARILILNSSTIDNSLYRVDVTSQSYLEINNSDMSVYDLFYKSSRVIKVQVMLSGL